jgi:hypothetical protein
MKKHEEKKELSDEEKKELSELMLKKARSSFEHFNNPYYAWYAIDVCIKNKKALPSWLIQYLAQCSERMLSGRARQTGDLRELLPWVIGFPKKRGPGNSLDPDRALDEISFTLEFVLQIMLGNDPVTARRNACEVLEGKAANVDDKTLMRWLLKQFNLKKAPKNAEQWKNVIRQRGDRYLQLDVDRALRREHFAKRDRVSRDPVVT